MLRGCVAAVVTPLRDDATVVDEGAFEPYVDFLVDGGVEGLLALGTTGEGILLSRSERERVALGFLAAACGRIDVAVHAGAQTTADTVALAEHAAAAGAAAVAVIGPPYFPLDPAALLGHFAAAAAACAPTSFYVYEFAARSGYAVPLDVIERLREIAPNLRGLKVSDAPWEAFEPYVLPGLDIFAGPEALIQRCLEHGGAGAVSGLASAFPSIVAAHTAEPTDAGSQALAALRALVSRFPVQAALKRVLAARGLPVRPDVRAPLRPLTPDEERDLERALAEWHESSSLVQA